jgi:hypothetical protein
MAGFMKQAPISAVKLGYSDLLLRLRENHSPFVFNAYFFHHHLLYFHCHFDAIEDSLIEVKNCFVS